MVSNFFAIILDCLQAREPAGKVARVAAALQAWQNKALELDSAAPPEPVDTAGHPDRPVLVAPRELVQRNLNHPQGQAALVHAIAHIEFNAINLALDAAYRFRDLPQAFYGDWLGVAAEEAQHFMLLRTRLQELGADYGDFPAHNGLWEAAMRTAHDPLVRMALVPRVLEARGLDVTPGMIARLESIGDTRTVDLLKIILRDEIGHVEIGSKWYRHLCAQRGVDPESNYRQLLRDYHMEGAVRGPLHREARLQAGFSSAEIDYLEQLSR